MYEAQYYHFPVLKLHQAMDHFRRFDPQLIFRVYVEWVREFERKSNIFYQSQYNNHRRYAEESFERHFGFGVEEIDSDERMVNWDAWRSSMELDEHTEALQSAMGEINVLKQTLTRKAPIEPIEGYMPTELFNELWFNTVINQTDSELLHIHRTMPYDQYLNTDHWKRVRSALLLIRSAVCQSIPCYEIGDGYWDGWETYLHVHHMTYKNRGNERYADLLLLCNRCHERYHIGKVDHIPAEYQR